MKQHIFNKRRGCSQVDVGPTQVAAAFFSQDRTSASFSGCIEEPPLPEHRSRE